MTTPTVSFSPSPKLQFFDSNGVPASGYKIFTYQAGTTTKLTTYSDNGSTPNTNPIVLNTRGECVIELDQTLNYKIVFTTPTDTDPPTNPIWTVDNINNITYLLQTELASQVYASQGSSLIGYRQSSTSQGRTVESRLHDVVSVFDYMTTAQIADVRANTATLDVTAAIQAAINSTTGNITIYFPSGTYKVVANITIVNAGTYLVGDGVRASIIDFEPTANTECFTFEAAAGAVLYNTGVEGIGFFSNDTTLYRKKALTFIDCSDYTVADVGTVFPHLVGASSIFINIQGRDMGRYNNISAESDRPVVISPIPSPHTAVNIGCDQHNFNNCYFICSDATRAVVEVTNATYLTNLSFTGQQSWVGGKWGFTYTNSTSIGASYALSMSNIRWEQGPDATGYLVYLDYAGGGGTFQGVEINNCKGGDRNGFYFRHVDNLTFINCYYTSTSLEALNVDSTVREIHATNCFWQAGSTITFTGQHQFYASPLYPNTGPLAPSFHYTTSSNALTGVFGFSTAPAITLNGFTITGSVTATAFVMNIGKSIQSYITITCSGGGTIASVAGTSYITGLPSASQDSTCTAVRKDSQTSLGDGYIATTNLYTPAWSANANAVYVITSTYLIA